MGSKNTTGGGRENAISLNPQAGGGFIQKEGSAQRTNQSIQNELALEILAELYPLLLENCTDDDDEIDTQAMLESLAGLVGLFMADYQEGYGETKAKVAFQELVDLALTTYQERSTERLEANQT